MKNMINIIIHDFRRLTSSVVAIIILLGLCVVPCLYAWFNIFSNWDPYGSESTGRMPVAVANEDKGAEMLGLSINVGEKLVDALKANDSIGWVFVDDEDEAIEGVRAGDYYAAVVVPEDFSDDVMSFTTGELEHPVLQYYENVKKNALAPKITGKAKSALQEEVDAAFVDTLGKYITEAAEAADSLGLDPQQVFGDLSGKMDDLAATLDDTVVLVQAASGLSNAANELLAASDSLVGSSQNTLKLGEDILDRSKSSVKSESGSKPITDAVRKETETLTADASVLHDDLSGVRNDMKAFNKFVDKKLESRKKLVSDMKKSTDKVRNKLADLGFSGLAGRFDKISQKLDKILNKMKKLEKADKSTWPDMQKTIDSILDDIASVKKRVKSIESDVDGALDGKLEDAVSDARKAISELKDSLSGIYGNLDTLGSALSGSEQSLDSLQSGLEGTLSTLQSLQNGCRKLADMFETFEDSGMLNDVNHLLTDGSDVIAENLAKPVKMKTEVMYPVRNNGSVMAPFYTVLAQWVGALLSVVLISTSVKRREGLEKLRVHEKFFGRYRIFLIVGLLQALIVSLGDLLYIRIQCEHPVLFVLAACVCGITFTMINYALVFALDNIGKALAVIVLLVQVAGAGGTFPPDVLPPVFRFLYPAMPFRYGMDAMRECVAGTYGSTYIHCIGMLGLFTLIAVLFGLLMYYPALWLNRMISESMDKSDLMV